MIETELTSKDKKRIEASIRGKYAKVAGSPEGLFKYPTGRSGLETLKYDLKILQALPEAVAASYCGVGNPFTLGPINPGEAVLDIGCGAGVDTIVAATLVGPTGTVTGIDMVPEMLAQAKENVRIMDLKNVTFTEASAEKLPLPDASFDVVISNGVFNLIPDKSGALAESFRVLKPKGRLMLADQILVGELREDKKARIKSWFR
ncbi:MAG: methyltransferase domain-containing protein [Syntrophobacteria bacterium]